jgi:hypothetical protein
MESLVLSISLVLVLLMSMIISRVILISLVLLITVLNSMYYDTLVRLLSLVNTDITIDTRLFSFGLTCFCK